MSRTSVVLVSLLPSLAGLLLMYLCIMCFLTWADTSSGGHKMVAGMGALLALAMICMPIMGFLMTPAGPSTVKPKKKDDPRKAEEDDAGVAADSAVIDDEAVVEDEAVFDDDAPEGTAVTDDSLEVVDGSGSEIETFGTSDSESDLDSEFDTAEGSDLNLDIDVDEDDTPRKKKR